ncbi:MAG TPA: bifunctional [glutamate--ammonia ligase]-adenylyl-L-tyrosine phosphorylase/[glutamate--ammonia-ligase] adenylyltransferase, partial [Geobacteraceae bacterium]|nr:bifunctional [glutamate--ammonia ligase]-adenylyl-L-tyrosine phosphorylase/[glutamate--ammonia-ligase] adenylyltransferase [Geobacteraceae bacterium]
MSPVIDIRAALESVLAPDLEGDNERTLVELLAGIGFAYPPRSATNIRLLADHFPPAALAAILEAVLGTAMPDMALNNLERISSVIPAEQLAPLCNDGRRMGQLLALLGSSPFLTNIICRDPGSFSEIFVDRAIDFARGEEEMLAALRARVPAGIDYQGLFPLLRRFKYREMLRIAARDLSG